MKLLVVLVASVCLVRADKNLGRSPSAVVRVGRNGRQVVSSNFANGPIRNGRRVARRRKDGQGRQGRQFHSFTPTFHAAAPLVHAAPHLHHAAPHLHHAAPLVHHAAPLAFHTAPLPVTHHTIFHAQLEPVAAPTLEYGAPATVAPEVLVQTPLEPVIEAKEAPLAYSAPFEAKEAPLAYAAPVAVKEAPLVYSAPEPVVAVKLESAYGSPSEPIAVIVPAIQNVVVEAKAAPVRNDPIAILRNINHPPAETAAFDSDFETANGIQQKSVGTVKIVDDTEVTVMEGSYSYIGADDVTYTVTWYADETGFHPSDPTGHFPKAVEPNHPEVAAAVKAQIAFAAEEDAAAAASSQSNSYAAPSYAAPLAYSAPQPAYQA